MTREMEAIQYAESKNEVLGALEDTYQAMAKFISQTRLEKHKTCNALKKIEALISINIDKVSIDYAL